jgi:hypothetical protein
LCQLFPNQICCVSGHFEQRLGGLGGVGDFVHTPILA